jgi:hypothetical protein
VDFSWSKGQIGFCHSVSDFARQELNRGAENRDRAGRFPAEAWKKYAEFGILLLPCAVKDGTVVACVDL